MGFGTGLSPFASGTVGTLPAVLFVALLAGVSLPVYLVLTAVVCVVGVWICDRVTTDLGTHDHGAIVWDEIAGYMVTMIAVPVAPLTLASGFFLFRLFDVWKPGPIRTMDVKVPGGLGIMIDDIAAGVLSCIVLHGLVFAFPVLASWSLAGIF